jgi:hypothetical protein
MRRFALAVALILAPLSVAVPAGAQTWLESDPRAAPTRPYATDRTGLTAVPLPAQGWCEDPDGVVRVRVDALDRAAYAPPRRTLQRFLQGVRFAVQQDCPEVWAIEVQGYAGGVRHFVGTLQRREDWRLQGAMLR